MYPWDGSWHSGRAPVACGPSQFQLQNTGSRGDKLVALVLCVLSWFTLPSGVYVSQWPRQTVLAIQAKLGGNFALKISMALGILMATGFLLAKMPLCTYTGSVWGMPHESHLNNAGGYTHLLWGGGGFTVAPRPHILSPSAPKQAPGAEDQRVL